MENNKIMDFPSFRKVWLTGSTLAVSVPREVREILKVGQGDRIKVTFHNQIVKKEKLKKEKEEKGFTLFGNDVEDDGNSNKLFVEDEDDELPEIE